MIEEIRLRQPYLNLINRRGTGVVPCRVSINAAIWDEDPMFFERLRRENPDVGIPDPGRGYGPDAHELTDDWGCRWHYPGRYLDGQVVGHPLERWEDLAAYRTPDPDDYVDWAKARAEVIAARQQGRIAAGHVRHGFLYLWLTYLRGFANFMIDVAEGRDELLTLRDLVADYWVCVVRRYVALDVDIIHFGDDLGHQDALPISPAKWRELLKPAFARIFAPCRERGVQVYLHTDGYVVDIIPDLIDIGVTVLNPQDQVNGLDNLVRLAKGRIAIDLDVDRQGVTRFGTAAQIDEHIERCIRALGSPTGGLMLVFGAYPGTPKENIAQVVRSMQKHHRLWMNRK